MVVAVSPLLCSALALRGRVLAPNSEGGGWWDARTAAMPVVLPPSAQHRQWRMFYYGRAADKWNGDLPAFLPTGVSGAAESDDGLQWTRIRGPLADGAILTPADAESAFDHVHVGITDVFEDESDGSYSALYLGGSSKEVELGMGPGPIKGFAMRPGAATSTDGLQWERRGPLLELGAEGEWDSNFVSWPRALLVEATQPGGRGLMTYHALQPASGDGEGPSWAVGAATCASGLGGPWTKLGKVLEGGAAGAWDERGIGTRHVVHAPEDEACAAWGVGDLVMCYEGVGADGRHKLGLATSADGGASWTKVDGLGGEPGGPIFEGASPEGEGAWDDGNVGTPWLLRLPAGGWRLYYVGTADKGRAVVIACTCTWCCPRRCACMHVHACNARTCMQCSYMHACTCMQCSYMHACTCMQCSYMHAMLVHACNAQKCGYQWLQAGGSTMHMHMRMCICAGTSDKGRTVAIGAAESEKLFSSQWTRVDATC